MLSIIGESPIDTITGDTFPEAAQALSMLRRESRALQVKGWRFNTDEGAVLLPGTDGTVALPLNCLSLTFVGADQAGPYTFRANKVYNRQKQTFTIGKSVNVDMVVLLPFEDIPESARHFIAIAAARKFQDANLGDGALHQFGAVDEQIAWAEFLGREVEDADYNINRDSPSVRNVTLRRAYR